MAFHKLNLLSSDDPFENYKQVVKSKHKYKDILYGSETEKSKVFNIVKDCYSSFEGNKDKLENIGISPTFDTFEKDALLHCYNGNTKKVRDLKDAIINNQNIHYRTKCAYCGIGDSNYMDHYLPKDDFPQYSVHIYNLIPSCSYCNEKKSKLFLDKEGVRKIFNPYFEEIGNEPILICNVECIDTTIISQLKLKDDFNNKVWKNHLITLNLIDRYEAELPRVISTIMFDIIANFEENGVDADGAKRVLRRKLNEFEEIQGINSLDAVVYRAYLENDQLFNIDYIKRIYYTMSRTKINSGISAH